MSIVLPVLCLAIATALFMLYRLGRLRGRIVHHELGLKPPQNQTTGHRSCCDTCEEKRHAERFPSGLASSPGTMSQTGRPRRSSSINEPHFAETTTRIRRISSDPRQPDTIQRVNSVSSTLLTSAQPSSEVLPFGGRRGSAGSALDYTSLTAPREGQVSMGERRPSALSDPDSGFMSLRRVSVGGTEDVLSICSGSQSSDARRRSLAPVVNGASDGFDGLPSPVLPSSHPVAAAGPFGTFSGTTQPLRLKKPPVKPVTKRLHARPDSLVLTKAHQDTRAHGDTRSSPEDRVEALRSSDGAWSAVTTTPVGEIFEAWRGFPVNGSSSSLDHAGGARPISPRTPAVGDVKITNGAIDTTTVSAVPEGPEAAALTGKFISPRAIADGFEATTAIFSPAPVPESIVLTGSSPRPSPASGDRITYLADVVRENEEKRRLERQEASSVVALASLEERKMVNELEPREEDDVKRERS